jgi:low affinity Fe/Cu permease
MIVWAYSGPLFSWSDTGQLVINTGTTIITSLMGFLIQGTQSRYTRALHLKLDELIRLSKMALLNLEEMSEAAMPSTTTNTTRLQYRLAWLRFGAG